MFNVAKFEYFAGMSACNCICRNIFSNAACCLNNGSFTYMYASQNCNSFTNPYIVSNKNISSNPCSIVRYLVTFIIIVVAGMHTYHLTRMEIVTNSYSSVAINVCTVKVAVVADNRISCKFTKMRHNAIVSNTLCLDSTYRCLK